MKITISEFIYLINLLENKDDQLMGVGCSKRRTKGFMGNAGGKETERLLKKLESEELIVESDTLGTNFIPFKVLFDDIFKEIFVESELFKRIENVCKKYGIYFIR